jgi:sulfur-carrier protein
MRVRIEVSFSFKHDLPRDLIVDVPEGASVFVALETLANRFPQVRERLFTPDGRVRRHINALVNGKNVVSQGGYETILHDADRLTLLPPVGGG